MKTLSTPSYDLTRPAEWASGVIFASPHSGSHYPDWFLAGTRLPTEILRSSEDAFMDRMIAGAPAHGAATLTARIPRCIVDLNRALDEIDPQLVSGIPHHPLNQRTVAGLGVIPRVVSQGRAIHHRPIPRAEAERRLDTYWRPYHAALAGLIAEARARFGQAILIDMHSMPHDALSHLGGMRPDIVLGNRHGLSAAGRIIDAVASALETEGWRVRRNSPFSGAYIAQAYGRPAQNVHVVQVEIDRALYMDEARITPLPDFDAVRTRMDRVVARLARYGVAEGGSAMAAE
ncbi:N-formylglutamate amidohydrolase (plasmid) [Paracoccus sp. TK19116]|uniref:N-formylglutamate amidohydrolase n=1 Tax=Paracoccus albicereus TaxID=2922394 RepID=A0ABT1MMF3_9RHOB|nr:N-formylglutamate amidohydrolase [Paracoccus albicereus]MCQ0969279.1 N-formylglutamate amidohydrolase [Paracoccus albicereus]